MIILDITKLSENYLVRRLDDSDIKSIYNLAKNNDTYYQHFPPIVTRESIAKDMKALPSNKTKEDKYYLGYFFGKNLIAVLDLIVDYPSEKSAFIGFFMLDRALQNQGIASKIITELCNFLKVNGYEKLRLAWVKTNTKAQSFWRKNGFVAIDEKKIANGISVIEAEREL